MKTRFLITTLVSGLFATLFSAAAQEARFFRIAGPVRATITAVTAEGWVTWTNDPTNATFTVQTATLLGGESNWVDWVQVPASNGVTVHRVFDPNPPEGMALVPAGAFVMGNCMDPGEGWIDELPLHTNEISASYMDRYEVTKALWDEARAWGVTNGYTDLPAGGGKAANHPVQSINWYAMVKWCNARSEKENLTPVYCADASLATVYKTGSLNVANDWVRWSADGYRLPTEAEWEKAARGGTPGHRFPWSDVDTIQHCRANYPSSTSYAYDTSPTRGYHPTFATGGFPYTSPVGYFAANGYGLDDMAGNVWEWCWDWYSGSYYGSSPTNDPRGPTSGSHRVVRGGGWNGSAYDCRAADRGLSTPGYSDYNLGFRCVRAAGQ
jgi:formylglycine-generating enzyme required for sulfatase activity